MDLDHDHAISVEEMTHWSKQGNNVIDRLATIMEHEVYQIWLEEQDHQQRKAYSRGKESFSQTPQPYRAQNYGPGAYGEQCNQGPAQYGQQPRPSLPYPPTDPYQGLPAPHSFVTEDTHNSVYGGGYTSAIQNSGYNASYGY